MQGLWLQAGANTQYWSHTEPCLQPLQQVALVEEAGPHLEVQVVHGAIRPQAVVAQPEVGVVSCMTELQGQAHALPVHQLVQVVQHLQHAAGVSQQGSSLSGSGTAAAEINTTASPRRPAACLHGTPNPVADFYPPGCSRGLPPQHDQV